MWLGARHHRQPGLGEAALQRGRALLMAVALGWLCLEMADRGERAGGERRRQRGREDEARRVAAQKIDERRRARDIAADRAERLAERALDHVGRCMTPSRSAMPPPRGP